MQTIFTPQATSPTFVHLQLLHSKTIPSVVGAFLKYCNVMFSVSIYQDIQWALKSNTITTPSKVIFLMVSSCKYTYWFEIMLKVFLKQIEWWGWIFAFFRHHTGARKNKRKKMFLNKQEKNRKKQPVKRSENTQSSVAFC